MANSAAKAGTYAERLIENEYVQENLTSAAESLHAAYRRASKRRVQPTRDKKLHRQLRRGMRSLREAASALQSGRRKPKRRGRRVVVLLGAGAGAAAVVIASNDELRRQLFGDGPVDGAGLSTGSSGGDSRAPVMR